MEFWKTNPDWINEHNDVLILAGDIHVGPEKLTRALEHFSFLANHVIYVPGNHEYYGYNLDSYNNLKLPSNVHFLNPGYVKINDVVFIGTTLWTDFHNDPRAELSAQRGITDFKRIKYQNRRFNTQDCVNLFLKESSFLRNAIQHYKTEKKVIITHFLPSLRCVSPYWQVNGGVLNKYFAPSMDNLIDTLENTKYWFFGHTHDSVDLTINNTQFISNPYGYSGHETNTNFNEYLEFQCT